MPSLPLFKRISTIRSVPVTGYQHFLTPLRKLIFDHDPLSPAQAGLRCVTGAISPFLDLDQVVLLHLA